MDEADVALLAVTPLVQNIGHVHLCNKPVLSDIVSLIQKVSFALLGILSPLLPSAKTPCALYYMLYICAIMQTAEHCYRIFQRRLRVKKFPGRIRSSEMT